MTTPKAETGQVWSVTDKRKGYLYIQLIAPNGNGWDAKIVWPTKGFRKYEYTVKTERKLQHLITKRPLPL